MRVGVIGLGTMGAPMARHLLAAGHEVTVHNRTWERELPLAELGAARGLLESCGKRITYLGPSGSGQMAKAVNQVMIAGTYATVAEGIALAQAAGLPLPALVEALSAGAASSWVLTNRSQNMIEDAYP